MFYRVLRLKIERISSGSMLKVIVLEIIDALNIPKNIIINKIKINKYIILKIE